MAEKPTGTTISRDGAAGSVIVPHYVERHMTFHPVTEDELGELSFLNTLSLACFSTGSFLLSLGIAFWANQFFSSPLSAEGRALSTVGAAVLVGLAVVGYLLGIATLVRRSGRITKIKSVSTSASVRFSAEADGDGGDVVTH